VTCKLRKRQCCQPCGFPANLGLFFVELRVFLKTCGLLVFGLVLVEICLFFGLVFCRFQFCRLLFFKFYGTLCCFNLLLKAYWACFYKILVIFGLFFRICLPAFSFNFVADFSFCWIFMPTPVGLVFRWNYLILACFSNLLACFCKITWRHWEALLQHFTNTLKRWFVVRSDSSAVVSVHCCITIAVVRLLNTISKSSVWQQRNLKAHCL